MFFFVGAILFAGLILLRKYVPKGFIAAQAAAGLIWAYVQVDRYFEIFLDFLPLWILASLAALAVKPKEKT
ncbi:MAG: hypothetical protein HFJ79_06650 [Clostridiales bacterium]|nr:hypothetical protein [Clostridiales bacterium]